MRRNFSSSRVNFDLFFVVGDSAAVDGWCGEAFEENDDLIIGMTFGMRGRRRFFLPRDFS